MKTSGRGCGVGVVKPGSALRLSKLVEFGLLVSVLGPVLGSVEGLEEDAGLTPMIGWSAHLSTTRTGSCCRGGSVFTGSRVSGGVIGRAKGDGGAIRDGDGTFGRGSVSSDAVLREAPAGSWNVTCLTSLCFCGFLALPLVGCHG